MKVSRYAVTAAAVIAVLAMPVHSAHAQQLDPTTHFGVSAGLNIPLSDLSREVQTGYIINGLVQGTPQGWPVALRGELSYSAFAGQHNYMNQNITRLGVDAVLPLVPKSDGPYFLGGLSLNHVSHMAGFNSENDFGFDFGGGLKWQLNELSTFVELRYMYVAHSGASRQMLPLTFGVIF